MIGLNSLYIFMGKHELERLGYELEGAPDSDQTLELRAQTQKWWRGVLDNREKLLAWLHKLYNTEKEAYRRFVDFAQDYCAGDAHHHRVFTIIAQQEAEHAEIIKALLEKYEEEIDPEKRYSENYWNEVQRCIVDRETAAGVGFFAEDLSLQRMLVIIEDEKTPDDLRELFARLHGDEKFHVNALKKIAEPHGISRVIECHSKGLQALGLSIRGITTGVIEKLQ